MISVTVLMALALAMNGRLAVPARADSDKQPGAVSQPASQPQTHRPEDWNEDELRAFRGAISTVRLDIPFGPRPRKPDNVVFTRAIMAENRICSNHLRRVARKPCPRRGWG